MPARVALACLLLCGMAQAEPAPPPPSPPPTLPPTPPPTLGVALSGGVSLGAYEAGFLHGLIMPMRDAGVFPRVLTGTSAGSINAFVGALQACSPGSSRPTDSLLYQIWVPTGLDKLFVRSDAQAIAALTRAGFEAPLARVRQRFGGGLDARCDLTLGFAVTHARARPIPLGDSGTTIPRMTEHVLVRLRGRGAGVVPSLENATARELGRHHLLLPLDGPDAEPFDAIASTLLGSSGFPLAFPPQHMRHCEVELAGSGPLPACTRASARDGLFVDGGLFDNRPIGIALSLLAASDPGGEPLLAFIDPDLRSWPAPKNGEQPRTSALAVLVGLLSDFVATARSTELDRLLAHDATVTEALRLGRLYYPPASEPLGAFFGFIDRELRRFDFYLGLYHARRFRIRELGISPEEAWREGEPNDPAWRPLFCLHAVFDQEGDAALLCAGDELADFRAIARHAIERVAEDCLHAGDELGRSQHALCVALARGRSSFSVPGVPGGEEVLRDGLARWRRRAGEPDSDWTLRRLAELGFRFHDLGLTRATAHRAPLVLRGKLGEIVDALATRQGVLASHLYRVVGEIGLNLIRYAPPRHLLHVLLGNRLEVGYSWTEPTSVMRWLRLEATFGLWGLDTLFSDAPVYFGMAPAIGVRLEPLPLSRSLLQPRLGLHGGFLFSSADRMLSRSCDVTQEVPCSRPMAEADLSVALLSVLRLQLSAVWFPAIRAGERQRWSITPGIALQLPFAR
jgi:hypothetical protein